MTRFLQGIRLAFLSCVVSAGAWALSSMTCGGQSPGAAAGQEAQFEVASIKPDDPKVPWSATNLDLDASDYFRYQGGPVIADGYLVNYIVFAYKLRDSGEYKFLDAQLPKWAQINSLHTFRLEARAGDHPTKEMLRSMVRSLLAERFGLKVHTETQQQLAWVLVKASNGHPTSQLRAHTGDPVCTTVVPGPPRAINPRTGEIPPYCGSLILHEEEGRHLRIQDYTMPQIAGELSMIAGSVAGMDELPAVDGTQMTGHFDLDLHYAPRRPPGAPDDTNQGPDLLQALFVQAGLEFKKKTVPVELLIVDHVNEPTPN
jgi:uncharacterized protein (TIGR03435 family)